MSIIAESLSHEESVEAYLKDIAMQIRLMNARIEDAFKTDITLDDIETVEENEDGYSG